MMMAPPATLKRYFIHPLPQKTSLPGLPYLMGHSASPRFCWPLLLTLAPQSWSASGSVPRLSLCYPLPWSAHPLTTPYYICRPDFSSELQFLEPTTDSSYYYIFMCKLRFSHSTRTEIFVFSTRCHIIPSFH